MGRPDHQRVVQEAHVLVCVADLEYFWRARHDGMRAEGGITGGLRGGEPVTRFEPLPVGVHERHEADWHVECPPPPANDVVKCSLRGSVEDVEVAQSLSRSSLALRESGRRLPWKGSL